MKKSLIALAVAGAFAVPAMAATSNIDISGKIAADVTFLSGANLAGGNSNTHQVNNNNSVITVAGNEDLGGGLKAFFSVSYGLPLANAGALAGQNQIAGLEGGFGKVFVGAFDNPLKVMGRATDLFADQSTGDARYLTSVGAVEARANDVLAYISPSFSGFQVVLAHTNNPTAAPAVSGVSKAPLNILKLAYANGPLSLAYGHHKLDLSGIGANVDEKADRLTGSYSLGDLKFVGSWQKVDNAAPGAVLASSASAGGGATGVTGDYKVWGLGVAYKMGPMTLKTQYYNLDQKGSNTNDAKMWALGADYALSKRTTAQLAYAKVTNDTGVRYGYNAPVAGSDAYTTVAGDNGKDPGRFSIGLKHTF